MPRQKGIKVQFEAQGYTSSGKEDYKSQVFTLSELGLPSNSINHNAISVKFSEWLSRNFVSVTRRRWGFQDRGF